MVGHPYGTTYHKNFQSYGRSNAGDGRIVDILDCVHKGDDCRGFRRRDAHSWRM